MHFKVPIIRIVALPSLLMRGVMRGSMSSRDAINPSCFESRPDNTDRKIDKKWTFSIRMSVGTFSSIVEYSENLTPDLHG